LNRVTAPVEWKREISDFDYQSCNRRHDWKFDAGITVRASVSPAYQGSDSCVDPEEAFVASLSGCQMPSFMAIACKKRFTMDGYTTPPPGR
jgi:organic hydroperoxide reductase OsmC/OhrA